MDIYSIILFVVIAVVIYLIFKFIVSPLLRLLFGLVVVLVIFYVAVKFFNFDMSGIFGQYGKFVDISKWPYSNYVTVYIDMVVNKIIDFYKHIVSNLPK